jgi:hypothetical protein
LIEPNPDTTDLADIQQFDIDSYLTSYLQTVKPSTPAKEYLKNTIDYVTANIQGKRFYDLLVSNTIADKVLGRQLSPSHCSGIYRSEYQRHCSQLYSVMDDCFAQSVHPLLCTGNSC